VKPNKTPLRRGLNQEITVVAVWTVRTSVYPAEPTGGLSAVSQFKT